LVVDDTLDSAVEAYPHH
jgi:hypothetical protein